MDSSAKQKFGERLKQMRKSVKNINQTEIGKLMGVKQSTISRWEAGIDEPEHDHIRSLSEYFKCTTDYLLGTDVLHDNPRVTSVVGYVGAGGLNI
ncbi:MAG: helix-turn-helix transcriptional regulator, partial [Kordiimonadaceae bacterium]|nr:helix-turn-helix transcriptional regulator [Kordiimonadaceae bacterium]